MYFKYLNSSSDVSIYTMQILAYQNYCPVQQAALAEEDVWSHVKGWTDVEMSPKPLDLSGVSRSTC